MVRGLPILAQDFVAPFMLALISGLFFLDFRQLPWRQFESPRHLHRNLRWWTVLPNQRIVYAAQLAEADMHRRIRKTSPALFVGIARIAGAQHIVLQPFAIVGQ